MRLHSIFSLALFSIGIAVGQVRPPNYSPDALPETSFTCEDKVSGSYYADVEADCQLFHVCVQVSEYEFQDFHFLCPNDTVFDQQHLVCTNWFDVDCRQSFEEFVFDPEGIDYTEYSLSDEENRFLGDSQPSLSSGLRNAGRGLIGGDPLQQIEYDYDYGQDEDVDDRRPFQPPSSGPDTLSRPPITSTPIPVGFTTTRRPPHANPRVKANIRQNERHQGRRKFGGKASGGGGQPEDEAAPGPSGDAPGVADDEYENDHAFNNPFENPPFASVDGKKPRVKANLNNRLVQTGQTTKAKKQGSKKVELDRSQLNKIDFIQPTANPLGAGFDYSDYDYVNNGVEPDNSLFGPDVKPDGRAPRVKSNILAKEKNNRGSQRKNNNDNNDDDLLDAVTPLPFGTSPALSLFDGFSSPVRTTPASAVVQFTATPAVPPIDQDTQEATTAGSVPFRPFSPVNNLPPGRPDPFNLGPPPQPKIPPHILAQLPPPANRPGATGSGRPTSGNKSRFPASRLTPAPPTHRMFSTTPATFTVADADDERFISTISSGGQFPGIFSTSAPPSSQPNDRQNNFSKFDHRPLSPPSPVASPPLETPSFAASTTTATPLVPSRGRGRPSQFVPPRNRFGTKPRVKSNELAAAKRKGNSRHNRPQSNRFNRPRNFNFASRRPDGANSPPPPPEQNRNIDNSVSILLDNDISDENIDDNNIVVDSSIFDEGGDDDQGNLLNAIRFVPPNRNPVVTGRESGCSNPFKCPPKTFAGGRKPRVKANIKARKRNYWYPKTTRRIPNRKKNVRLNPIFKANILGNSKRQGRKQNLAGNHGNSIDQGQEIEAEEDVTAGPQVTTPDPVASLQELVRSKDNDNRFNSPNRASQLLSQAKVRSFQNKRLKKKRPNKFRTLARDENDDSFTDNSPNLDDNKAPSTADDTDDLPVVGLRQNNVTPVSIFVTFPATTPLTTAAPLVTAASTTTKRSVEDFGEDDGLNGVVGGVSSHLPNSVPTQMSPAHGFTLSDAQLFVTNPRALMEHHHLHPSVPFAHSVSSVNEEDDPAEDPDFPNIVPDGRKPRVKSNIIAKHLAKQNQEEASLDNENEDPSPDEGTTPIPVLKIIPDGRAPRVKSNMNFKKKKSDLRKGSNRIGAGRSLDLDSDFRPNSVDDDDSESGDDSEFDDYLEPEVKPDGRAPRVKSNLRAKKAFGRRKSDKSDSFRNRHDSDHGSNKDAERTNEDKNAPGGTHEDVTTFRPSINVDDLISLTTESQPDFDTLPPHPILSQINQDSEPAFSDFPRSKKFGFGRSRFSSDRRLPPLKPGLESATEIVTVSLADRKLFQKDTEYDYYDYYSD